jgi:hypothetical protein
MTLTKCIPEKKKRLNSNEQKKRIKKRLTYPQGRLTESGVLFYTARHIEINNLRRSLSSSGLLFSKAVLLLCFLLLSNDRANYKYVGLGPNALIFRHQGLDLLSG